jgi:hypothetical protein
LRFTVRQVAVLAMVNVPGYQVAEGVHIWPLGYGNYVMGIGNHIHRPYLIHLLLKKSSEAGDHYLLLAVSTQISEKAFTAMASPHPRVQEQ